MLVSAFSVGQSCVDETNCTTKPGSLSEEFELTGNRAHWADFSTSSFMFGCVIGAIFIPRIADM